MGEREGGDVEGVTWAFGIWVWSLGWILGSSLGVMHCVFGSWVSFSIWEDWVWSLVWVSGLFEYLFHQQSPMKFMLLLILREYLDSVLCQARYAH